MTCRVLVGQGKCATHLQRDRSVTLEPDITDTGVCAHRWGWCGRCCSLCSVLSRGPQVPAGLLKRPRTRRAIALRHRCQPRQAAGERACLRHTHTHTHIGGLVSCGTLQQRAVSVLSSLHVQHPFSWIPKTEFQFVFQTPQLQHQNCPMFSCAARPGGGRPRPARTADV